MTNIVIDQSAIKRRAYWIDEIVKLSGNFGADATRVEAELLHEIGRDGPNAVLDHLRLCGAIPESYGHDSSEEKLYSKYTDALLAVAFIQMGLKSVVLVERANSADVEAVAKGYSFVADAKVFRLSRTAKNQKDFKVQAMDNWKRGKPFAIVVSPLYQLPSRNSQIYEQAAARNVCLLSYAHMAVLVCLAQAVNATLSTDVLHNVLKAVEALNPSTDANQYWQCVNRTMLSSHKAVGELWRQEKMATLESIVIAKEQALTYLSTERDRIMRLSLDEAIKQLLKMNKLEARIKQIQAVSDNNLMNIS